MTWNKNFIQIEGEYGIQPLDNDFEFIYCLDIFIFINRMNWGIIITFIIIVYEYLYK